MSTERIYKAFSGDVELAYTFPRSREEVRQRFPREVFPDPIKAFDSFSLWVGQKDYSADQRNYVPVTRRICYKVNGTKHKCGGKCRTAKGGDCECECGGRFHGIERFGP